MLLPLFRRQQVRCNSLRLRSQLPKLSLCWSYNDQISRSFLNPKALRDFSIDEVVRRLCTGQCTCHSMDPKFKCASATLPLPNGLTSGPHVLTLDPTICGCTELITMAAKGLNYIPIPALDLSAWSEQLRLVAVDFLAKLQQAFPGEHDVFCPEGKLLRLLHAWVDMQLQERRSGFTKIKLVKPDTLSVPATRSLSALQKSIYFCEVDKAPHQPCFICLDFAIVTLWQRLNSTDFRRMPDGEAERLLDQVMQQQARLLPGDLLQQMQPSPTLLSTRFSYKAHKRSFRFITNGSDFFLTPIDTTVQLMSAAVLGNMELWAGAEIRTHQLILGVATQPFPIIKDYTECILNLPNEISTDFTADIARCFEAIPTDPARADSLPAALEFLTKLVFGHLRRAQNAKAELRFRVVFGRDGWPTSCTIVRAGQITARTRFYTAQQFLDMCSLLLSGAVTSAGGVAYHQHTGIPMGLRASPDWCNLYLLHKEVTALQRIIRYDPREIQLVKLAAFLYFFRSMDDLRVINGQALVDMITYTGLRSEDTANWVYPACLGIDITSTTSEDGTMLSTCFLDIITHYDSRTGMSHTTYAKESKLPFKPIQFVDPNSNRPVTACYNIVIGVTLHAILHASSPQLAIQRLVYIMGIMRGRGYLEDRLRRKFLSAIEMLQIPGLPYTTDDVLLLARRYL